MIFRFTFSQQQRSSDLNQSRTKQTVWLDQSHCFLCHGVSANEISLY